MVSPEAVRQLDLTIFEESLHTELFCSIHLHFYLTAKEEQPLPCSLSNTMTRCFQNHRCLLALFSFNAVLKKGNITLLVVCSPQIESWGKYFDNFCFHISSVKEFFIILWLKRKYTCTCTFGRYFQLSSLTLLFVIYHHFAEKQSKWKRYPTFFRGFLKRCSQLCNPLSLNQSKPFIGFYDIHKNAFCIHSMNTSSIGDASPTYKIPFTELYQSQLSTHSEIRACWHGAETNWLKSKIVWGLAKKSKNWTWAHDSVGKGSEKAWMLEMSKRLWLKTVPRQLPVPFSPLRFWVSRGSFTDKGSHSLRCWNSTKQNSFVIHSADTKNICNTHESQL